MSTLLTVLATLAAVGVAGIIVWFWICWNLTTH